MNLYSLRVLEYAAVERFPNSVIMQSGGEGTRRLPYGYVLITGPGVTALVDVGYRHEAYGKALAESYGVSNWHAPEAVLAECQVAPQDVTHVFITHAHFDHMGNIAAFPNAIFYIQEAELREWVSALAHPRQLRWLLGALDPADLMAVLELAANGRLVAVDGDREDVLPGIDLRAALDTHTPGCMFVHVRNDGLRESQDSWILCGDLIYSYENLLGPDPADPQIVPIGLATGSQTRLIETSARMLALVQQDWRRVVPVHEERLPEFFPTRVTEAGLRLIELTLADGDASRIR